MHWTLVQRCVISITVGKTDAIPAFTEPAFNGRNVTKKLQKQSSSSSWQVVNDELEETECVGAKGRSGGRETKWGEELRDVLPKVKHCELAAERWGAQGHVHA